MYYLIQHEEWFIHEVCVQEWQLKWRRFSSSLFLKEFHSVGTRNFDWMIAHPKVNADRLLTKTKTKGTGPWTRTKEQRSKSVLIASSSAAVHRRTGARRKFCSNSGSADYVTLEWLVVKLAPLFTRTGGATSHPAACHHKISVCAGWQTRNIILFSSNLFPLQLKGRKQLVHFAFRIGNIPRRKPAQHFGFHFY